jgi:hypothetical protein
MHIVDRRLNPGSKSLDKPPALLAPCQRNTIPECLLLAINQPRPNETSDYGFELWPLAVRWA